MDRPQLQRFETQLEQRYHDLRLTIRQQLQYARHAEAEPDTVDQAASGFEKESSLTMSNKDQQLLQMVASAIGRIRDGTFGHCLSCGTEINEKRLTAVPWTRYCIQCQENSER